MTKIILLLFKDGVVNAKNILSDRHPEVILQRALKSLCMGPLAVASDSSGRREVRLVRGCVKNGVRALN